MPIEWAAKCRDLVKTYQTPSGYVRALRGVTAEFPRAALTAVVGPSGSGKSSLLRVLAGIDRPTSGTVLVANTSVHSASSRQLRRLRRTTVGYVFQRPSDNFIPHLTLGEHLRLAASRSGHPPAQDATSVLDELGMAHRAGHLPAEISGGEQQRAAFAQVLMTGARIILADEPTAELDTASAKTLLERVRDLVRAGATVVVATHDANVTGMADEVLELHHGVLDGGAPCGRERTMGRRLVPGERGRGERARDPLLEIRGVGKVYRRGTEVVPALRDVTLELRSGEVVGLVGRSGSGKTTLLNVLAGWERADRGTLEWAGVRRDGSVLSWRDLAVVPQKLGLIDDLTLRKNIEYPCRLAGALRETRETADELIEALALEELQARFPKETSVGEQQRAALARALVLSPRLVLADEPTGHQDKGSSKRVFDAFRSAAERGTCCLVATHNEEVVPYLDRVLVMSDGRLAGP